MSYGLIPVILAAAVILLFCHGLREEKRKKQALRERLEEDCGRAPRAYRKELTAKRGAEDDKESTCYVDGITWRELEMDTVFRRLDYTLSQAGTEYLYTALHHPAETVEEAGKWEFAAAYFTAHAEERMRIREILAAIGKAQGNPFSDCLRVMKEGEQKKPVREYVGWAACLFAGIVSVGAGGAGVCLLLLVLIVQMVTYFRERARVLPFLRHIVWLLGMIQGMESLYHALPREICREAWETERMDIAACLKKLNVLRRHSFWIRQSCSAGSPLSLVGDYIRILFHPDIVQFMALRERILSLEEELCAGYAFVGYMDACISICLYRMSLKAYCIPALHVCRAETALSVCECVHPLLEKPVANSIRVTGNKGVLLTGSNASGKSTFLKTIAVNLLLAQTIHTALATEFCAPLCHIYTAMADGGDIRDGRSSYMAEILSLKRILDADVMGDRKLYCFVDEILRGTGSVERISAAASILRHIRPPRITCFAATHDRELTYLLEKEYDNYYFTEEVAGSGMIFSYRLRPGRADTCNAIRLLAAVGYEEEIVQEAFARAKQLQNLQSEEART